LHDHFTPSLICSDISFFWQKHLHSICQPFSESEARGKKEETPMNVAQNGGEYHIFN